MIKQKTDFHSMPDPPRVGHIFRLAEIIREADGNHSLGAAALAEAILAHPDVGGCGIGAVALSQPTPEPLTPISEFDLMQQWNAQAGEDEQWHDLEPCEQLAWAQVRAIAADSARCGQGNG